MAIKRNDVKIGCWIGFNDLLNGGKFTEYKVIDIRAVYIGAGLNEKMTNQVRIKTKTGIARWIAIDREDVVLTRINY